MRRQEYHARDKTVKKMSRDGLTEEKLNSGVSIRISQREVEERVQQKTGGGYLFSWFGKRTGRKNSHEKKAETAALHS